MRAHIFFLWHIYILNDTYHSDPHVVVCSSRTRTAFIRSWARLCLLSSGLKANHFLMRYVPRKTSGWFRRGNARWCFCSYSDTCSRWRRWNRVGNFWRLITNSTRGNSNGTCLMTNKWSNHANHIEICQTRTPEKVTGALFRNVCVRLIYRKSIPKVRSNERTYCRTTVLTMRNNPRCVPYVRVCTRHNILYMDHICFN